MGARSWDLASVPFKLLVSLAARGAPAGAPALLLAVALLAAATPEAPARSGGARQLPLVGRCYVLLWCGPGFGGAHGWWPPTRDVVAGHIRLVVDPTAGAFLMHDDSSLTRSPELFTGRAVALSR